MKYSFLFPLAIISLALSSCTLIPSKTEEIAPTTDVATLTTSPEETTLSGTSEMDPKISNTGKTPATPADNTPKTTVSTDDLTKDLDAFVDDITKGL